MAQQLPPQPCLITRAANLCVFTRSPVSMTKRLSCSSTRSPPTEMFGSTSTTEQYSKPNPASLDDRDTHARKPHLVVAVLADIFLLGPEDPAKSCSAHSLQDGNQPVRMETGPDFDQLGTVADGSADAFPRCRRQVSEATVSGDSSDRLPLVTTPLQHPLRPPCSRAILACTRWREPVDTTVPKINLAVPLLWGSPRAESAPPEC